MKVSRELRAALDEVLAGRQIPGGVTTGAHSALADRVTGLAQANVKLTARVQTLESLVAGAKAKITKAEKRHSELAQVVADLQADLASTLSRAKRVDKEVEDRLKAIADDQTRGLAAVTRKLLEGTEVEASAAPIKPKATKKSKPKT